MTPEDLNKAFDAQEEIRRANRAGKVKWLKGLSDDQLRDEQMKDTPGELGRLIDIEVTHRTARSGLHWTLTPGFVVLVITMVFAGIAAWPTVHDWIWPRPETKAAPIELAPASRIETTPSTSPTQSNATTLPLVQATSSPSSTPITEPEL